MNAVSKRQNAIFATKQGILLKYVLLQNDKKKASKNKDTSRDRSRKKVCNVVEGATYDSES